MTQKYWKTNWKDFWDTITKLKGIEQVTSIIKGSTIVRIVHVKHQKSSTVFVAVGKSDGIVVDLVRVN